MITILECLAVFFPADLHLFHPIKAEVTFRLILVTFGLILVKLSLISVKFELIPAVSGASERDCMPASPYAG